MAAAVASCVFGAPKMLPAVVPSSVWGKMALGGTVGLLLSNVLLHLKILPRSFAMADEHGGAFDEAPMPLIPPPTLKKSWPQILAGGIITLVIVSAWVWLSAGAAALITLAGGMLTFLIGVLPRSMDVPDEFQQVVEESADVNARWEMGKEILFLIPPICLAVLAACIPLPLPAAPWLARLSGILLGLLVGGGSIWVTRILGTLLMGRIAMGAADAPLLAAIGAVVGAPAVAVVFFLAPILGLVWAVVLKIQGKPNVMPYGPWLSMAAILTLFVGNPIVNWYAGQLFPTAPPSQSTMIWPGESVHSGGSGSAK